MPAADDVRYEVRGLKELQRDAERLARELPQGIQRAMGRATLIVEREAKIRAPVDTGRLRASITPEVEMLNMGEVRGIVGSNVSYAPFQELGTRFMEGRRFLRGALEAKEEQVIRALGDYIDRVVTELNTE